MCHERAKKHEEKKKKPGVYISYAYLGITVQNTPWLESDFDLTGPSGRTVDTVLLLRSAFEPRLLGDGFYHRDGACRRRSLPHQDRKSASAPDRHCAEVSPTIRSKLWCSISVLDLGRPALSRFCLSTRHSNNSTSKHRSPSCCQPSQLQRSSSIRPSPFIK